MKTGDLVRISLPTIDTPTRPNYYLRDVQGKTGLIIGFPIEQERFHPYYRIWSVMIDGNVKMVQGMNLVVISDDR